MSSVDGVQWSSLSNPNDNSTSDSPSLAIFNNTLSCAFKANDSSNNLYFISSTDGKNWSPTTCPGGNKTHSGPTITGALGSSLICMFRSNDDGNRILQFNSLEADWMQQNISSLGLKKLKDICIVGSHNAGMSICKNPTEFAKPCNTVTQTLDILGQLQNGARYFDIRPTISGGVYRTGHYSDTRHILLRWQGSNGQSIDDIISDINTFTSGHNELVILKIWQDLQTDNHYQAFSQAEMDGLLKKLSSINYLYINTNTPGLNLTEQTVNEYIGSNRPRVLITVEPRDNNVALGSYDGNGFFAGSAFPLYDEYSDINQVETMITDQIKKMRGNNNAKPFLLSWTLTQSKDQAKNCSLANILPSWIWWTVNLFSKKDSTSILELAGTANSNLWNNKDLMSAVSKSLFPQIIYIDDVGPETGAVEMAMKMNSLP